MSYNSYIKELCDVSNKSRYKAQLNLLTVYCNKHLIKYNKSIGGVLLDVSWNRNTINASLVKNTKGQYPYILVSEKLLNSESRIIKAVLGHEMAHLFFIHTSSPCVELEADLFSINFDVSLEDVLYLQNNLMGIRDVEETYDYLFIDSNSHPSKINRIKNLLKNWGRYK